LSFLRISSDYLLWPKIEVHVVIQETKGNSHRSKSFRKFFENRDRIFMAQQLLPVFCLDVLTRRSWSLERSSYVSMGTKPRFIFCDLIVGTIVTILFASMATVVGSDWPQYRGQNHDGGSTDKILKPWPKDGPYLLWKVPLDGGFSSFTVSQGQAYTQVGRTVSNQVEEICVALNADTGTTLWTTTIGALKATYPYPRYSTPVVDGNRVYVLSAGLVLTCLSTQTGQVIWQRDLVKEFNGRTAIYGNAASPAVDGNLVFVNCNATGDKLLAFQKTDGSLAWKTNAGISSYADGGFAPPIAVTILEMRQIIFMTGRELLSVAPNTGAVLWRYSYSAQPFATPLVADNIVFATDPHGSMAV
jgi:outer membrane protein assembly factor BamB